MCITKYNEKSLVNGIRAEESERIAMKMLKKNKYSYEEIADNCDLTIEQVKDLEVEILQRGYTNLWLKRKPQLP